MSNTDIQKCIVLEKNYFRYDACHQVWGMLNIIPTMSTIRKNVVLMFFIDDVSKKNSVICRDIIQYVFVMLHSDHIMTIIINGMTLIDHQKLMFVCDSLPDKLPEPQYKSLNDIMKEIEKYENDIKSNIFTDTLQYESAKLHGLIVPSHNEHIIMITDTNYNFDERIIYSPSSIVDIVGINNHNGYNLYKLSILTSGGYYCMNDFSNMSDILQIISRTLFVPKVTSTKVRLLGHDGCRITAIFCPHQITENQKAKDYIININNMSKNQTILFKLSLRNIHCPFVHKILNIEITSLIEKNVLSSTDLLSVDRYDHITAIDDNDFISSIIVDQQLNRSNAVNCISECINHVLKLEHILMHNTIYTTIKKIANSVSGHTKYCKHIISDLLSCEQNLLNKDGINFAYSILSKHITELY